MKFLKIRLNKKPQTHEANRSCNCDQNHSKFQLPACQQAISIPAFRRLNCAILVSVPLTVAMASELQNNKSQEDNHFPPIFYFDISHLCPFSKF